MLLPAAPSQEPWGLVWGFQWKHLGSGLFFGYLKRGELKRFGNGSKEPSGRGVLQAENTSPEHLSAAEAPRCVEMWGDLRGKALLDPAGARGKVWRRGVGTGGCAGSINTVWVHPGNAARGQAAGLRARSWLGR